MNRKNTILIAVLINTGLLTVLFIAALSAPDPILEKKEPKFVEAEVLKPEEPPLYQELHPVALEPLVPEVKEEKVVTHPLPKLVEPALSVEKESVKEVIAAAPAFKPTEVVVKKGDTLEKLARANQTTVDEIIKLNRLPSSFLKIGQVLKMPASRPFVRSEKTKVKEAASPEYYTIKVGENPWAIANRHHMKLEELLKLNKLNEEKARKLRPGDRLRIR